VTVEGVVTWQEQWSSGRVYFLQDGTAGISTFHSGAPALNRGDRIRITGDVGAFAGEAQLSPITALTVLGQEAIPSPRAVTGAQINAGEYQGELATVGGTVDSVVVINDFDTHIVWLTDDASTVFTAYVDNRTGVASAFWTLGSSVTLTGVLGTNDNGSPAARIEPRDPDDIQ
jgi:predicted extracellular nuclease